MEQDECRATDGAAGNGREYDRRAREVAQLVEQLKEKRSAEITLENVEDVFAYHAWSPEQKDCGDCVREALIVGVKAILRSVPPGALRTRAIDCLVDARMIANAAITFRGRF